MLMNNFQNPKDDINISNAVKNYVASNGLNLSDSATFHWGIDHVSVRIQEKRVLIVNLPPISNYEIDETEHTDMYLRAAVAV